MPRLAPPTLLALPAVLVALIVLVVLMVVGLALPLAILAALVAGVVVAVVLWRRAPAHALRQLGAVLVDPTAEPRLANVVEGLCVTFGHDEPRLHIVETDAVNAAVLGHSSGDAHLVVTRGLLETLDRLELEAVVARQLSQLRAGVESSTVLVSVATLLAVVGLRDRLLATTIDVGAATTLDIEGVRSTRYPPALASAYEKATGAPPVASAPSADHLWLLAPASERSRGLAHLPLTDRIDVLREL